MPRKPIAESLVLEALTRNFPDSLGWNQILEATKLSRRAVHNALNKLVQKGMVQHEFREKYSLTIEAFETQYPDVTFDEYKKFVFGFKPEYVKEHAKKLNGKTISMAVFYNQKMPITIGDYDTPLLNSLEESIAKFHEDIKNIISKDKLEVLLIAKF